MKSNIKTKILIGFVLLGSIILIGNLNIVDAQINTEYYDSIRKSSIVSSSMLSGILSTDILLDPIAKLIYSIGNFLEYIVGAIVLAASGTEIFPWADGIVFNAIPLLDVNFISPASGSIVLQLKPLLQGLYNSIFALTQTFFSIAILIMAIKLAISTIASEKAMYKEAIVKWAMGLVMLFGMQYFISFVFYLNEQLVYTASSIVMKEFESPEFNQQLAKTTKGLTDKQLAENFLKAQKSTTAWGLIWNATAGGILNIANEIGGIAAQLMNGMTMGQAESLILNNSNITGTLLRDDDFREATGLSSFVYKGNDDFFTWPWDAIGKEVTGKYSIPTLAGMVKKVKNTSIDSLKNQYYTAVQQYEAATTSKDKKNDMLLARAMYNAKKSLEGGTVSNSFITSLAQFFKKAAWVTEENGWKPTKAVLQNAILYAILVVQSVILLIAYVKRLFYVIVLALMAPVVVVYDFMKKI